MYSATAWVCRYQPTTFPMFSLNTLQMRDWWRRSLEHVRTADESGCSTTKRPTLYLLYLYKRRSLKSLTSGLFLSEGQERSLRAFTSLEASSNEVGEVLVLLQYYLSWSWHPVCQKWLYGRQSPADNFSCVLLQMWRRFHFRSLCKYEYWKLTGSPMITEVLGCRGGHLKTCNVKGLLWENNSPKWRRRRQTSYLTF